MADTGLPFLPGAATVSEVLPLLEAGLTEMKFFPAEASGGAAFLKSVAAPVPAARFCPTGGITAASAASYLALPNVGCVGGSWLTPKDLVAAAAPPATGPPSRPSPDRPPTCPDLRRGACSCVPRCAYLRVEMTRVFVRRTVRCCVPSRALLRRTRLAACRSR